MSERDEIIKRAYISASKTKSEMLRYFISINTKCLIDDKRQRYSYIDENRLRDELRYYRYYGFVDSDLNILNISLPLILSNTGIEKSEREIIDIMEKYLAFVKSDIPKYEYAVAGVIYNEVIHFLLEDKGITYEDIMTKIKEKVISFNPAVDKSEMVKFQMYRIGLICDIDKYIEGERSDKKDPCTDLFNVLYDVYIEDREEYDEGVNSIKSTVMSILGYIEDEDTDEFLKSMAEYLVRIRKYEIQKKAYKFSSNPLDIIKLNEGDSFTDPILNKSTVISKKMDKNTLYMDINSKSGIYRFRFLKKA